MFKILCAIVLTELLTELVIKSEIFKAFREKIGSTHSFFRKLLSCGYCFSVWAALGVVLTLNLSYAFSGIVAIDYIVSALLVHRVSNYLHNFNDKWLDKYYDMRFTNSVKSE